MTTTASTLKLKSEISRISQILQANGVAFEEARPLRARRAGARASRLPARRAQVDLSLEPARREEMFEASKTRVLPQLHCDGKARRSAAAAAAASVACALPRLASA